MSNLRKISLENFRCFQNETSFKIAPITILIGPNNSGKSSFIKAIQLIDSNSNNLFEHLSLKNHYNTLGKFASIINKSSNSNSISLSIDIDLQSFSYTYSSNVVPLFYKNNILRFILTYSSTKNDGVLESLEIKHNEKTLVEYKSIDGITYRYFVNLGEFFRNINEYIESIQDDQEKMNNINSFSDLEFGAEKIKLVDINRLYSIIGSEEVPMSFIEDFENMVTVYLSNRFFDISDYEYFENVEEGILFVIINKDVAETYDQISHKVGDIFTAFPKFTQDHPEYAKLIVDFPLKTFLCESTISHIREIKSRLISYYRNFYRYFNCMHISPEKVNKTRLFRPYQEETYLNLFLKKILNQVDEESIEMKKFVETWIGPKGFNIGDKFDVIEIDDSVFRVEIQRGKEKINLADFGFGIKQVFTLICYLGSNTTYRNTRHGMLFISQLLYLIEEPESNLHPSFQSRLADLFADGLIKFNNPTYIIETHSEYIIRRLQYLVAEKKLKPEDVVIQYFTDPYRLKKDDPQVREINILSDGRLSDDFGPGFFDEAINLKLDLLRLKNASNN